MVQRPEKVYCRKCQSVHAPPQCRVEIAPRDTAEGLIYTDKGPYYT